MMQLIQDGNEYILILPSEAEHSLGWKLGDEVEIALVEEKSFVISLKREPQSMMKFTIARDNDL